MNSSLLAKFIPIVIVALAIFAGNCNATNDPPPVTPVQNVDLARYMGLWYEIARFDHFFQEGCRGSTATYTLIPSGEVEIINRCVKEKDASLREAKGHAWSVDPKGNARLKVSFFWPFRTDYWILDLGREYEYAVVGSPNRKYLWILSRKPVMEKDVYKHILDVVVQQGFDIGRLVRKP